MAHELSPDEAPNPVVREPGMHAFEAGDCRSLGPHQGARVLLYLRAGFNELKFIRLYFLFGSVLGVGAAGLTWYWFGWKMALVIFLSLWANNIGQRKI